MSKLGFMRYIIKKSIVNQLLFIREKNNKKRQNIKANEKVIINIFLVLAQQSTKILILKIIYQCS